MTNKISRLFLSFVMASVVLISLSMTNCAKRLTDETASVLIKSTFHLDNQDAVEILGISEESSSVRLVKAKVNDRTINTRMRKYDKGWQLEEVQNDLGIWLPASSIVNLSDPQEKVKTALKEIMTISTGLVEYITDHGKAPINYGSFQKDDSFYSSLAPFYLKKVPIKDPWGNNYLVYGGEKCNGNYGLSGCQADEILVISYGADGKRDNWIFEKANPEGGYFVGGDYSEDLICWNGEWIRAPKEVTER